MRRFSIPYLLLLFIFFIPLIPLSSSQDVKRGNQNPGHPKQIRNQLNPPRVVVDPQQFEIELDVGDHRETSFNIENQNDHALEWEIQLEVIENQLRDNTPLRDDPGDYLEEIEAGVENTSGLAWDGRLMWGCDFISNVLRAYNPVEAEVVVNTGTRDQPLAMTFDGERILVSNYPQNLILSYDLDGNLVDEIEIEYNEIQGLAHDKARLLFVNTGVDNLIHVFNNDMEEIAEIDYHESMDNQEVWSIVWVPEHPDGQLWGLSEGRAFQVSVNENWEVETVQDFRINSDHDFVGIAHDGSNMWHGSWETDRWYVFDDGVDEGYWISFNPQSGALEANSNTDVQLALNAELLFGGEYQAVLHVLSDDEDNPEIEVEVSLIVTGIPEFVIEWEIGWEDNYIDWNDYHQVYSHGVYPVEVTFRNIGTDILSIEEIYSESDAFRPSVQNLELDPHQSAEIDFIFTPDTVGEYSGEMIIISNDPDHEEGIINLRGQAQEPPGIVIEPLEIEDRLLTGQSSEHSINIFNDGEAPLQWELQIEIVTEPDRDFNTRNLRHSPGRDEPGEVLYEIEIPYGVNQYKNLGYDADNNWMWLQQYAPPRVITAYNLNGFDPAENEVPEIAVSWESVATFPMDMAVNDGIIYVMELWNEYLGRFDLEGNRLENLDLDLNGDDAVGVAIDPIHNRLFVAGNAGEQILCVFDLDGERIAEIGSIRPIIGNQWWRIIDWVSDHQDGQFWVNSGGSLSQLKVDTANWEFVGNEPVSSFDTHSTQPYDGFAHDGANFWVSSYADNLICVYDDGILESDWILSDQYQGELNENEETDIIITMDATSLIGGNYEACLHFMSNDPDDEDVEVVVNMDVTGAPDLQLSWAHGCENNEIDWSNYFEEIFASGEYPVDITFRNNGTEDLIIESISCENEYFNPDIDEFVIEPIERQDVQFIFAPRETGNFNSTMVIICNDPDTEEIEIALSGQSFAPPEVIVEPMEIEDFLITGESAEHIINIRNRGEAVLQWEIEIDFTGQPEQDLSHRNLRFVYQTSGKNGEHQLPSRDNPGDIIASYEVPYDYTTGLQWDGELMWGLAFSQDRLYALDPIDGEIVHDFQIHDRPANITFDGMNFWIGAVWNERVYIYDRNGDQIDEFSLITFDGIACDQTQYIFLNGNDRRIHVFDMETHQEIVDFAFLHLCDNHDVDCIEWVPQHPNGQLWCLVDNYAYQIHVNDNWQAEAVQNFRWNADEEFVGISHDGENLWHGMRNERNWYVHDDGAPESNWLVIDPTSGELARNQETDVTLTLNADFCVNGVYEADVNIFTNDPDDELITVHVTLEVEGAPDIRVGWHIVTEENTINWNDYFDPLYNHGEYGVEIWIRNTGTDVLHINNIHCENNAFIAAPVRFNLGVNETESVSFIFRPNNAGDYENVMVISSDDPNQPEYEINLRAHAFAPPMIIITPLEIEDMLMTGEQSEFAINVSNDGEADLQWRTTMEIISEPGRDDNTRTLRGADDILRRDDPGDVVGSYDVPMENTSGLQWIDNRMWGFFIGSNRMYALDPDNREIEEMFQIPDDPTGFAFDGRNIWMGQSWDNVAYEYDRNGNLLDRHQMINFDGISCVEDDFLLLNSQNDNLIHVYDMDNLERVAEIQFINLCDNGDIDCIEWVPSHPDGQLWCLATGHVYQLYINDDWQAELVQHIQLNVDDEWCGLGHDGTNLWHGMENERRWYALDDGVEESRWISYDPKEGELSREEDTNIFVLLDATGCLGGMYEAGIYFFSNDPECEEMEVTITLEVEGAPDIDTDWKIGADENTINWNEYFIEVFNNGIYEIPVEILNVGTDVLEVDDIVCNNRLFTSEPIDFVLDPRTSQDVIFIFSPEESGEYHEVMSIFSNDHDEEEVQIQLVAQSFSPPIIIINPLEIEDMLVTGETSEHSVNISNEGEANLRWSSTLEIISEPGRDENARSLRSVGSPMRRDDPGDVLAQYEVPFLNTSGLQWVDGLMWGTSTNSNLMIGLDPETQEFVEELQIINSPTGLSFDGTNFWIGQSWNNVAFVYDRNGNLVDSHVMINFDGITCIEDDFLLLNSQEDNLIHVFDRENLNEIARINYLNLCDQRDIDCIEWVSDHPEGQLWCMGTGRVFQLYVNENWEPEFVQQFAWNADDEWCGIAHDGENLWHGMEDERIWYVYDDGVIETRWITFEPKSGELEREQDVNIFVNLDATGCLGGMYEAGIHILSNDPDDEEIEICITLEVEGAPDIDADWEIGADENIINWNEYYDEVFVNGEYDIIVEVINAGTDVLEIDDIDCDNELFSVEPADFVLDPRTSRDVILTFAPVESDEYNETMTIYSNDHDEAEFEISLVAHSFNPPIIAVTPLEIDDSLYTGDEAEHSFNIYNEGEALLRWETDIEIINEPGRDENIRSLRSAGSPVRRDDPGDILAEYEVPIRSHTGLAWDGELVWGISYEEGRLVALDPDNGEVVVNNRIHNEPLAMAFDGELLWIGHFEDNTIQRYDLNGEQVDNIQVNYWWIYGLTFDNNGHLLLNAGDDGRIHVYNIENMQEITEFAHRQAMGNRDIWGIAWVDEHEGGQLWGETENRMYQTNVDDDWNVEAVQNFACNNVYYYAICHDGEDFWCGGNWDDNRWYVFDDGIIETRWIVNEPENGELEYDDDINVNVYLNAEGCIGGHYEARIHVLSNDPEREEIDVTVTLDVEGAPDMVVDWEIGVDENIINWNEYYLDVFTNGVYVVPVTINNIGTDPLEVNDIRCENDVFHAEPTEFSVAIDESQEVVFSFAPEESEEYDEIMTIYCDDPDNEEFEIQLLAVSAAPPEIVIRPHLIEDRLIAGVYEEYEIGIYNYGEALLRWSSSIEIISEPERDQNNRILRSVYHSPQRDSAGDIVAEYEVPFENTSGLQWVGGLMWGITRGSDHIFSLDPENGDIVEEFQIHEDPTCLSFDGINFWIGQSWGNNAYEYDRDGNLVDVHGMMITIDGITCIEDEFLLLNSQEDNLIHVFDRENLNEIARINYLNLCNNRDIDCIEWVSDHPDGQLWCMGTGRVFQLYVNENWEPEFAQQFVWNADDEWCGIAHDGENLWHGMEDERMWYVYDD
ncbi:hypothetical protein K9N50_12265, partial [bacterium]|nr:hypothetical protein [bacterium]